MKQVFYLILSAVMLSAVSLSAQNAVNDDVCDAIGLSVNGATASYSNVNSTIQPGEAAIAPPGGNGLGNSAWFETGITSSVWFTFQAPSSGAVDFDMCNGGVGTDFDTQIAVYEVGDCNDFNTFTLLGANDDIPNGCPGPGDEFASRLEVNCLSPGQTYYILVDGWFSAGTSSDTVGTFGITLTEIPAPPLDIITDFAVPTCSGDDAIASVSGIGGGLPYSFSWTLPGGGTSTAETITGLDPGEYVVELRDACDTARVDTVVIPSTPPLSVESDEYVEAECDSTIDMGGKYDVVGGFSNDPEEQRMMGYTLFSNQFYTNQLRNLTPGTRTALPQPAGFPALLAGDFNPDFNLLFCIGTTDFVDYFTYGIETNTGNVGSLPQALSLPAEHAPTDVAYDPVSQNFYFITAPLGGATGLPEIHTIDLTTGANTKVTDLQLDPGLPSWFAIDNNGTAYMGEVFSNGLFEVDLSTGVATKIGELNYDFQTPVFYTTGQPNNFLYGFDKADVDPETNELYATAYTSSNGSELRRINKLTASSFSVGRVDTGRIATFSIMAAQEGGLSYEWSPANFIDDPSIADPQLTLPGDSLQFRVVVTDACGTSVSKFIGIALPDAIDATLEVEVDSLNATADVAAVVESGAAPFTYQWDDPAGTTDSTLTGVGEGTYTVIITDANGCSTNLTVEVEIVIIGLADIKGLRSFRAFPNPATGQVQVEVDLAEAQATELSLLDLQGKVLRRSKVGISSHVEQRWSLDDLAAGLYLLRLRTEDGQQTIKLSVK